MLFREWWHQFVNGYWLDWTCDPQSPSFHQVYRTWGSRVGQWPKRNSNTRSGNDCSLSPKSLFGCNIHSGKFELETWFVLEFLANSSILQQFQKTLSRCGFHFFFSVAVIRLGNVFPLFVVMYMCHIRVRLWSSPSQNTLTFVDFTLFIFNFISKYVPTYSSRLATTSISISISLWGHFQPR